MMGSRSLKKVLIDETGQEGGKEWSPDLSTVGISLAIRHSLGVSSVKENFCPKRLLTSPIYSHIYGMFFFFLCFHIWSYFHVERLDMCSV